MDRRTPEQKLNDIIQPYMFVYNCAQTLGWLATLTVTCLCFFCYEYTVRATYLEVAFLLKTFQGLAALEIFNAAVGLVRTSPISALMQWAGRSNVLFCIVAPITMVQKSVWLIVLVLCWSCAEVVRYPWYTMQQFHACPGWLTWLRYTLFIPLYPLGVAAEMALMWQALPALRSRKLWSFSLPNKWNFAFHYHLFIEVLLLAYPFLFWRLYSGLLRQRRSRLGRRQPAAGSSSSSSSDGTGNSGAGERQECVEQTHSQQHAKAE